MFPVARVAFWAPIFDPQPNGLIRTQARECLSEPGVGGACQGPARGGSAAKTGAEVQRLCQSEGSRKSHSSFPFGPQTHYPQTRLRKSENGPVFVFLKGMCWGGGGGGLGGPLQQRPSMQLSHQELGLRRTTQFCQLGKKSSPAQASEPFWRCRRQNGAAHDVHPI